MNSLDSSLFKRTLSLADLPNLIWRRKLLVTITTAALGSVGVLTSFFMTPVYEVTSLVSGQIGASPQSDATVRFEISPALLEQRLNSQAQILQSEEVVRRTIRSEGAATLFPKEASRADIRGWSPEDAAYKAITKSLTVRVEPNTSLVRVAFRHTNATVAVNFLRDLVQNFIDRNLELERDAAAVGFFQEQRAKYDLTLEHASAALESFSDATNAFSIEQQLKHSLERRNSLMAALAQTRGNIAERVSQIAALETELLRLRPRATESKQLGLQNSEKLPADANRAQPFSSEAPLLMWMVHVYQDSVQTLVRLRSEVAGFRALQEQQGTELANVDEELRALTANEAKFERLKRELELARQRVDLYAKKASEQQLEADLNANRFSSIRVVQAATMPLEPVFPKPHLLIPLALLVGLIGGVGAAILLELVGSKILSMRQNNRAFSLAQVRSPLST
jgi:uncharacterized protein involved in exopolysaccharide biosynthesis